MDKTLLSLMVLSIILVVLWAPQATLTLSAILGLSTLVTRGSWAVIQAFNQPGSARQAAD